MTFAGINHVKEKAFRVFSEQAFAELRRDELMSLYCRGECSHFLRFNRAKVRQSGAVEQASVTINLFFDGRAVEGGIPFTGEIEKDIASYKSQLEILRQLVKVVPADPYAVLPVAGESSSDNGEGEHLPIDRLAEKVLEPLSGLDAVGYYAGGPVFRGLSNSSGQFHWFGSSPFFVDFSLYTTNEKSVKLCYAGMTWDDRKYQSKILEGAELLPFLSRPARTIPAGSYRTYLGPSAIDDLIRMFSWNGIAESSIQRGESCVLQMRESNKSLSKRFSLRENFLMGSVPRFNEIGEMAPTQLQLIENGKLKNTLVSSRSQKEFGTPANGASVYEYLRASEMETGDLKKNDILKQLGTGLFLSNLHYLNWSDVVGGRITGMTRYACFWVENGEIVSPIQDLRFDDSMYNFFGDGLEQVTEFSEFQPNTDTYGERTLGGGLCPGAIVKDFAFTL